MKRTAKNPSLPELLDEATGRRAPSSAPAMTQYYAAPPVKRVPLNVRVPSALKSSMEDIARLWRLMAENEGHDNLRAIDVTYVSVRLMSIAAEEVWAQAKDLVGHEGVPRTDGTWKKIEESLRQRLRGSNKLDGSGCGPT